MTDLTIPRRYGDAVVHSMGLDDAPCLPPARYRVRKSECHDPLVLRNPNGRQRLQPLE